MVDSIQVQLDGLLLFLGVRLVDIVLRLDDLENRVFFDFEFFK